MISDPGDKLQGPRGKAPASFIVQAQAKIHIIEDHSATVQILGNSEEGPEETPCQNRLKYRRLTENQWSVYRFRWRELVNKSEGDD